MKKGPPLFQEKLKRTPFWMLVACVLVNRTRWSQAEPVLRKIKKGWPSARRLAGADLRRVMKIVRPLGLVVRRSGDVIDLAIEWPHNAARMKRHEVLTLPGCGRYAADSWAIFVEGRTDVRPTDKELKKYLKGER